METNQQIVQNLVEFISQTVSLNRRLEKKKVDAATVKLAFAQLDKKRKGYLDLADVYELCGEVSEDQLFVVFKWLDNSKTGDVTYEDFQAVIASPQGISQKNQQSNPVSSVKTVITTFLQNYDYSNNSKTKLGINEQSLASVYRSICQTQRKSLLTVEDLIHVFSQSKKCDSLCREEVKNMFRQMRVVNEKGFLEAFASMNEAQASKSSAPAPMTRPQQQPVEEPAHQANEEQLLDSINSEYMAQRNAPRFNSKNLQQANKFIQEKYPTHLFERDNRHISSEVRRQSVREQKKECDPRTGDIEELLGNIQKRREELRKGSLQRKKLIEEALSRKKPNFSSTVTSNISSNQTYETQSYSRPVSTPKANTYSQVSVNNYVDVNRNDFGKIFNRYRDERENLVNVETRFKDYERTEVKSPKYAEKTFISSQNGSFRNQHMSSNDWRTQSFKTSDNYACDTPKFSQTAQERFFERPSSASKVDRISQIREKISHLPERNAPSMQKETRQIESIIEKYRNFKPDLNSKDFNKSSTLQSSQYSQKIEQVNGFSSYLMNQSPSNLRGIENLNDFTSQSRKKPESYILDQKSRLNGSICQYRASTGSIQKQNLLKRAQEEAARKIQQIQRKAKLKVLERKSAVGLKWVK